MQNIKDRFLSLLELLNLLHEDFGIDKSQESFDTLSNICSQMQMLFSASILSNHANTFIATLSNAIQTHLPRIALITLEHSTLIIKNPDLKIKLMEKVVKITTNLNRLVTAYESFISNDQQELSAQSSELDIIPSSPRHDRITQLIEALKQPPAPVFYPKGNTSDASAIILIESEESSISATNSERISSYCSFFSKASTNYPKTMMASTITTSISLAYSGLSLLSLSVGSTLDALLQTDVTGVSHQTVIAATLLLTGSALCTIALVRTCMKHSMMDEETSSESEFKPQYT